MPRSGHQWACSNTCPGNHKDGEDDKDENDDEDDENDEDEKSEDDDEDDDDDENDEEAFIFYFQVGRCLALNISVTHTAFIMKNAIHAYIIASRRRPHKYYTFVMVNSIFL